MRILVFVLALLSLAVRGWAADGRVSASLDSDQMGLGEAVRLTVTVEGASGTPTLPTVEGLQFTPAGQASNFQWINGVTSRSTTYTYQVTADRAGTYAIPPIAVGSLHSEPLRLAVGGAAGGGGSSSASNRGAASNASAEEKGEVAFLRLILPKKEFYVGELIPAEIRAYFRAGTQASLQNSPSLASEAFALEPIDGKPRRFAEEVGGQEYTVLSWTTALTAVKPGAASPDLTMPVIIAVPQKIGRNQAMRGFFDDPFFDRALTPMVQREATLRSTPTPVTVLPLPAANRPADFSGAVGRFEVEAEVSPVRAAEGDPLTLRFRVNGQGNFDRVQPKLLTGAPGWRAYPPSSRFEPEAQGAGGRGTKTFEQAVIPDGSGKREVPALPFSFFDPEAKQYVTRTTAPIEIEITPAPAGAAPRIAAPAPAAAPAAPPAPALVANQVTLGRQVPSLRPVFLRPWFAAVAAAPPLLLLLAVGAIRLGRLRAGDLPRRRREARDGAVRAELARLAQAQAAGDAAAFFTAARAALQQSFGARWGLLPESITLAEVDSRAGEVSPDVRNLFRRADETAYSGGRAAGDDLAAWRAVLDRELNPKENR